MTNDKPSGEAVDVLAILRNHRSTCGIQDCDWCVELDSVIAAVAALIARNAELEAENTRNRKMFEQAVKEYSEHRRANALEREALAAENKALRADAERYRLLRQYGVDSYIANGKMESLDDAIDSWRTPAAGEKA